MERSSLRAKRVVAATKGFVTVSDVGGARGQSFDVVFKETPKGKEVEERVRRLSPAECIEVCAHIMRRNGGSKRRLLGQVNEMESGIGPGPSTALLEANTIATLTDSFLEPYENARSDRSSVGDVQHADHVLAAARKKFVIIVRAM